MHTPPPFLLGTTKIAAVLIILFLCASSYLYLGHSDALPPHTTSIVVVRRSTPHVAYATLYTSKNYEDGLRKLLCSWRKVRSAASPKFLILVTQEMDTYSITDLQVEKEVEIRVLNDLITFPNDRNQRYSLNWLKLSVWTLEEYSKILFIDSDTIIQKNLDMLFQLDDSVLFAAVHDMDKSWHKYSSMGTLQTGLFVAQPSRAIFADMVSLLRSDDRLQFRSEWAEQSFLEWYFRYDLLYLPATFNVIAHKAAQLDPSLLDRAYVLHFTKEKPWLVSDDERSKGYLQRWTDAC